MPASTPVNSLPEGRLTYRTYENGEGQTRYITEVVANEMLMLEKRPAHA